MTRSGQRQRRAALRLSALAAFLSALGAAGYLFGFPWLYTGVEGRPAMRPLTVLLIALCALSAALQYGPPVGRARRISAELIGASVVALGSMVVAEYALGMSVGLWTREPSPFTAAGFTALGAAIVLFDVRLRALCLREWLCFTAIFIAFVSLVGHAFGAGALYRFGTSKVTGVALPSGLALILLGSACLLARPEVGVMSVLTSSGPGGVLLRRLGLTAIVTGPLLGVLLEALEHALGPVELPLLLATGNVLLVCLGLALLTATAMALERSHEALEASKVKTQRLVELAPEGIFVADLSGRYTEVNDAGCRLLGLSREQILGKTIVDMIPPEDVERLWQAREFLAQGGVQLATWRLKRADGSWVPTEVTAKVFPDGRWLGFVRDISERLALEREHDEYRDFLRQVLESSTEYGMIAEDTARSVILWNEGARRTYGYEARDILGKPSELLVAPSALRAWQELHARGLEQGSAEGTVLARRQDGTTFAARIVCTRRLGPERRSSGVLIVMRDLSVEERHLAEQEFLARAGAELASCLEYRETIARIAQLAVSFVGDLCTIDFSRDGGRIVRRLTVHRDPNQVERFRALGEVVAEGPDAQRIWGALKSAPPRVFSQRGPALSAALATAREERAILEASGLSSLMSVPLVARGQLLAMLNIGSCDERKNYDERDLQLAEKLASRGALTLDNVQLFQQSRLQGALTTNLAEGALLIRARDAVIVYANPRFEAMFGYEPGELLGKPVHVLNAAHEISAEERARQIIEQLQRTGAWRGEILNVRKDGRELWCSASVSAFEHEEHGSAWIAVHRDITERKQLEEQTAQALRDKEVLLKEIHHRVKNNLQVISSLFSLQRERTSNQELKLLLDESRMRVASIALVHDQLYRSPDLAAIDFDEYLRSLISAIRTSYGAEQVRIEVGAAGVMLDPEEAVPAALLVCELVSNSLKHAFAGGPGRVWVNARRDPGGLCVLEVRDDGRGIPPDFDWTTTSSLGLRLVRALTRQLRGDVTLERSHGTAFKVTFALHPGGKAKPELPDASAGPSIRSYSSSASR